MTRTPAAQDAPPAMAPALRDALVDLLYRLGDDSLIIGHRNSEWTGQAPILEADIAFSSMAQDKMGHALAFYRLLRELGEADPDTLAFARRPEQFRCCNLVVLDRGDWAFSVARQFLFDEADAVRLAALAGASYAPLAALARKLRGEVRYHVMSGRMWVERLGRATPESRRRMHEALLSLWPLALGIFEPTAHDEALARLGIQPREADLRRQWEAVVEPVLDAAGLADAARGEPRYGGRTGDHPLEFVQLVDAMQKVYRLDPEALW